jgi:hypothetical protein
MSIVYVLGHVKEKRRQPCGYTYMGPAPCLEEHRLNKLFLEIGAG